MRRPWRVALVSLAAAGAGAAVLFTPRVPPRHQPPRLEPEPFERYYARQLARALAEGVPPGNQELLVRRAPGRSRVAILYVHGFGASRAEGEAVVEVVAEALGANVYYLRLPGHGGGKDAQARVRATEYLDAVDEAVLRARELGEKLVVIGSSTGGLLSAWAASRNPEAVSALVLASPLFGFRDPLSFLGGTPAGNRVVQWLKGEDRDASWREDPENRKLPGYDEHWLTRQRWRAAFVLHEVFRHCARRDMLAAVQAPALVLYCERDMVVDPAAIRRGFEKLGSRERSRLLAIEDGSHVMFSKYVRTDKETITRAVLEFLRPFAG